LGAGRADSGGAAAVFDSDAGFGSDDCSRLKNCALAAVVPASREPTMAAAVSNRRMTVLPMLRLIVEDRQPRFSLRDLKRSEGGKGKPGLRIGRSIGPALCRRGRETGGA